jgi:hypothetical protein
MEKISKDHTSNFLFAGPVFFFALQKLCYSADRNESNRDCLIARVAEYFIISKAKFLTFFAHFSMVLFFKARGGASMTIREPLRSKERELRSWWQRFRNFLIFNGPSSVSANLFSGHLSIFLFFLLLLFLLLRKVWNHPLLHGKSWLHFMEAMA